VVRSPAEVNDFFSLVSVSIASLCRMGAGSKVRAGRDADH
jgi:hypothetical protein